MQWLQAVADRAACGLMAVEGSTLFSEENSQVKKYFPDIIAGLAEPKDEEEEERMEPDSEQENWVWNVAAGFGCDCADLGSCSLVLGEHAG